ncbi:MAG: tRNA uridine-5-carboxymethylaminomethyl(34) synthesis enzyme MnmG [Clostridia bacterium]|nr:tRNA uridine-5-carboxymethylaminomethyl(34) synthesis enzyme MnmG [Clostridia bacterium]
MEFVDNYDAIVIGSGHAGCEACLALSRLNCKTLLVTLNLDSIGFLACNPSIGGTAKGQLAGEIDALGGEMAINADKALLQLRMLNSGKGPAVQSLRAQVDKVVYHTEMKRTLERQKNLDILQAEVSDILTEDNKVVGITTLAGESFSAKAVIVCTGVYLNSKVIIGDYCKFTGPNGFEPANYLTKSLMRLGFDILRFKTGTPARVDAKSIDYTQFEVQNGDELGHNFSLLNKSTTKNKQMCYLGYTSEKMHDVIRENISRAPLYSGKINGIGPRYCPSIEDKVMRFADKERHQLFLEPESASTDEVYVQGISSSMPVDVQRKMYRCIPGFENVKIMRFAYAIEYDCIDATQLNSTLESKNINGLYFAGQINGTSGYEEAGAQGLMAGINSARAIKGLSPIVLGRDEAYIGVLIDDLVTKNIVEPYRMMTSRAEYRLILRQDNCDMRLTQLGRDIGLVDDKRYRVFKKKLKQINDIQEVLNQRYSPKQINSFLKEYNESEVSNGITVRELIKRNNIEIFDLKNKLNLFEGFSDEVLNYVNTEIKYEGYIKRENDNIEKSRKLETISLPSDLDYSKLNGLRLEARQKLNNIKPITLGQAKRIDGVSPADINVIMIYLKMKGIL